MDEAAGHVQHPWCSRHRSLEGDMAVTFYGDPHGSFGPLLAEWEKRRPNHVVLLGDMDLERPLKDELEPLFRAGTTVWWILGNHDSDREARSEEHTSELQSLMRISYAVFCLKQKQQSTQRN